MGCLFLLVSMLSPRLGIALLWLFTSRMTLAFDSGVIGFLGFLLLPWTTLIYALCYAPFGGVSGFGWFLVFLGFIADIGSLGGSARYRNS